MLNDTSKQKLLNSTLKVIFENGLNNVTTAKIAKNAKLSEAMIYKLFTNKDKLIIETFLNIKKELNNVVMSKIIDKLSFEAKCYNIWRAHLEFFVINKDKLSVINQIEHSKYMTDSLREKCLIYSNFSISFFNDGIKNNYFKNINIEIAIALFFSPLLSIAESIINKRLDKSEEILKICFLATMDSLKL